MSEDYLVLSNVIATVAWAVTFSVSMYLKKTFRKDNPEKFSEKKLISTALYAAFTGLLLSLSGQDVTEENLATLSAQYALVAILIQNVVDTISRKYFSKESD